MTILESGPIRFASLGTNPTQRYGNKVDEFSIEGTCLAERLLQQPILHQNYKRAYDFEGNTIESLLKHLEDRADQQVFQALSQLVATILTTSEHIKPNYVKIINERFWELI